MNYLHELILFHEYQFSLLQKLCNAIVFSPIRVNGDRVERPFLPPWGKNDTETQKPMQVYKKK